MIRREYQGKSVVYKVASRCVPTYCQTQKEANRQHQTQLSRRPPLDGKFLWAAWALDDCATTSSSLDRQLKMLSPSWFSEAKSGQATSYISTGFPDTLFVTVNQFWQQLVLQRILCSPFAEESFCIGPLGLPFQERVAFARTPDTCGPKLVFSTRFEPRKSRMSQSALVSEVSFCLAMNANWTWWWRATLQKKATGTMLFMRCQHASCCERWVLSIWQGCSHSCGSCSPTWRWLLYGSRQGANE